MTQRFYLGDLCGQQLVDGNPGLSHLDTFNGRTTLEKLCK